MSSHRIPVEPDEAPQHHTCKYNTYMNTPGALKDFHRETIRSRFLDSTQQQVQDGDRRLLWQPSVRDLVVLLWTKNYR